jgi:hypothetical protein
MKAQTKKREKGEKFQALFLYLARNHVQDSHITASTLHKYYEKT